jgi:hypothetical protein
MSQAKKQVEKILQKAGITINGSRDFDIQVLNEKLYRRVLAGEGEARELIRNIQKLRKEQNMVLNDQIEVTVPQFPAKFEEMIKKLTNAVKLNSGDAISIKKVE